MADGEDSARIVDAADQIETRHLRSALEFAVAIAREGPKLKPPLPVPNGLRRYTKSDRLTATALNGVRRVLDGDDDFRRRLAAGATDELVDEVGRLWLGRPNGWEDDIVEAAGRLEQEAVEADLARRLARAEKRREAAERAAARSTAEIVERDVRIDELVAQVTELGARLEALRAERDEIAAQLGSAKMEARHARDREAAAAERERSSTERAEALSDELSAVRDSTHIAPDAPDDLVQIEPEVLDGLIETVDQLAHRLAMIVDDDRETDRAGAVSPDRASGRPRPGQSRPERRRPLRMPPGVLGTTVAGARFLFRAGAPVLVDGYNVSKLAWSRLDLAAQRERLITGLEMLARRFGTAVTVVFDGADVVGASTGRRSDVRVVFSSADETADDWIRDETRRLIVDQHVVVVTNDREIIDSVTAMGANHVSSDQLLELLA